MPPFCVGAFNSMKFVKRILKLLWKTVLGILCLVILYFLAAVFLSLVPVNKNFRNEKNGIAIYIRSNGVHTDFVIPVKTAVINWEEKIPYTDAEFADSSFKYICFGWGNREFYIETKEWSDLKVSTAFQAGCGLGETAMHIEFIRNQKQSDNCLELRLKDETYNELVKYVISSFKTDEKGKFIHINGAHYYSNDAFYEANRTYSLFSTCNEWTGKGLRVSGIRTGAWTPFDKSVMYQLRQLK